MSIFTDISVREETVALLKSLGLSDKESLVYLALLELGQVGTSRIIELTGLHGQFVYAALKKLEEKSLVQHTVVRGRRRFAAQNPQIIAEMLDQKRAAADAVIRKLNDRVTLPAYQETEIFQGHEAFIAKEFEILKVCPKGSEILVIGGTGDIYEKTLGKSMPQYDYIRMKKEISVRYIGTQEQRAYYSRVDMRKNFHARYLPGTFDGDINIGIYPALYGFYVFTEPPTSFIISSPKIVQSQKQFFETLWSLAKP